MRVFVVNILGHLIENVNLLVFVEQFFFQIGHLWPKLAFLSSSSHTKLNFGYMYHSGSLKKSFTQKFKILNFEIAVSWHFYGLRGRCAGGRPQNIKKS
jgi:hypothetical protein